MMKIGSVCVCVNETCENPWPQIFPQDVIGSSRYEIVGCRAKIRIDGETCVEHK